MNVETFDNSTEVGEAISNGVRRHQNAKCFNFGIIGHLRRDCSKEFLDRMSPLRMARLDGLNHLEYVGDATKTDIGPMKVDQQKTDKNT